MNNEMTDNERRKGMVNAYLSGMSSADAARKYGYNDRHTCTEWVKKMGHSVREKGGQVKYSLNESYFDKIDTEEKAYWLGFITVDGSVTKNKLSISLGAVDKHHLEKFKHAIKSDAPIYTYKNNDAKNNYVRINIASQRIIDALAKYGVCPNKIFTIKPYQQIPIDFASDYWRGIIDGDGSISKMTNRDEWKISLTGSKYITNGFRAFIRKHITTNSNVRNAKNSFEICFAGTNLPLAILRLLYEDASVFLDRKYQKAHDWIHSIVPKMRPRKTD